MTEHRKLVIFANQIGVLVETDQTDAHREIARAREFLTTLGGQSVPAVAAPRAVPSNMAHTLAERILSLGAEFFVQPRESTEIAKQLARAAFHYPPVRVRVELGRLVKRGKLRRIGDGTKSSPYKYVNR